MTHGSLFSGIGGFDLAAEWMGWKNVFHCEFNPIGQRVLNYYWPESISYGDIKQTDFNVHRGSIDVLTGGFPCQPYSTAGKRQGKEDDRHLWPEMLRAIREIQPCYVVGENVRGLTNWNGGLVFDEVQANLETEGYEVLPFLLPACGLNAPHRRERIWFIAYSASNRWNSIRTRIENENGKSEPGKIRELEGRSKGLCLHESFADTKGINRNISKEDRWNQNSNTVRNGEIGATPNSDSQGLQIGIQAEQRSNENPARTFQRSESTRTFTKGSDWEEFPTQSPICGGDDGLPRELDGITFPKWRSESIKAFGNAIVPHMAFQIFKVIEKIYDL